MSCVVGIIIGICVGILAFAAFIMFPNKPMHANQEAELKSIIDQYKDQLQLLKAVNEKSSSLLKIKNDKILDLITEVNLKNDRIAELNDSIVSNYGTSSMGLSQIGAALNGIAEEHKGSKITNNKLAFNYLVKKQENKSLQHDIEVYNKEIQRLEFLNQSLLVKLGSMRSAMSGIQNAINSFEARWLLTLESNRSQISNLKKTMLKKHLELSSKLNHHTVQRDVKLFVNQQLRLNQEIDLKNKQLEKLKDLFFKDYSNKNKELADLVASVEKELSLPETDGAINTGIRRGPPQSSRSPSVHPSMRSSSTSATLISA